jgi:hypothetical protein
MARNKQIQRDRQPKRSPNRQPTEGQRQISSRWHPETWISPSALIALCALGFSVYQGYLQRQFQRLSVRPRMTISLFYNNDGAGFMFGGTGIGYATLKTFEVSVDQKAQSTWLEMCRTLGFASAPTFDFVVPRPETVFKPDSYEKIFWIPAGPQAEELKLKAGRVLIKACYCSVFDECWTVDTQGQVPQRVSSCATPKVLFAAPPRQIRLP